MFQSVTVCAYCHSKECECGAKDYINMPKVQYERGIPFFYEGYIVWPLHDVEYRYYNIVFYQGRDIIDNIVVQEHELDSWDIEPGEDWFYIVWDMFKERNNIRT